MQSFNNELKNEGVMLSHQEESEGDKPVANSQRDDSVETPQSEAAGQKADVKETGEQDGNQGTDTKDAGSDAKAEESSEAQGEAKVDQSNEDHKDEDHKDEGQDHESHDHGSGSESHSHDGDAGHEHGHDHGEIDYLAPSHLFEHVQDTTFFHLPKFMGGHWDIAHPLASTKQDPIVGTSKFPILIGRPTKFMVLELVGALLLVVVFTWMARKTKTGERPKGRLRNFLETFVVFIRDEIARPNIGKEADEYLPFLLTMFFFVLTLNLFGMIPWLGSATGALAVTGVLALITFVVVVGAGTKKMGFVGFAKAQVPHMDLPPALAVILIPSIWAIEIFGLIVKHFVLAIRLFANMFAGHLVLSVFLAFIGVTAGTALSYIVGPAVILGSIAFSLLELFVAFLQAYIFTFLASLFIGSALHPH
ncbi:MAG: F0F1 ATP synthase subunit A [Planctomycetota bacterium]